MVGLFPDTASLETQGGRKRKTSNKSSKARSKDIMKSSRATMRKKERSGLAKACSGASIQRLSQADVKGSQTNQLVDIGSITRTKGCSRCIMIFGNPRWRPKRFSFSINVRSDTFA
jgi:hypothetical protein